MTLCINDSSTWRNITTQCVNDSGTWRKVTTGCINDSGTWRRYGFICAMEGGYLLCSSSNVYWIVAPQNAEVSRCFQKQSEANTKAQAETGCTGWFVPTCAQMSNPGYACRGGWDAYCSTRYWSSSNNPNTPGQPPVNMPPSYFNMGSGSGGAGPGRYVTMCIRSFRCVTY